MSLVRVCANSLGLVKARGGPAQLLYFAAVPLPSDCAQVLSARRESPSERNLKLKCDVRLVHGETPFCFGECCNASAS
jgi:hypothetical protein